MMDTVDRAQPARWMDLDAEGLLGSAEKTQLDAFLEQLDGRSAEEASALRAEREHWFRLHQSLAQDHTQVRSSFHDDVMASIDPTLWQKQESQAWRLPLAMMLIFALGAAWSLTGVGAEHPVLGTGAAIADFLQSTTLAGAGLAVASWRGAGMGLEELFAGSQMNLVALAVLVLCVNLLFVSLLRRRPKPAQAVADSGGNASRSESPDRPRS